MTLAVRENLKVQNLIITNFFNRRLKERKTPKLKIIDCIVRNDEELPGFQVHVRKKVKLLNRARMRKRPRWC